MRRPCLEPGCPALVEGSRCPAHAPRRDRPSTAARGYGGQHQRARAALAGMLPAPCGYAYRPDCPRTTITPGSQWVAAHVVDGHPEYGWMAAHPECNQRAKGGGGPKSCESRRP